MMREFKKEGKQHFLQIRGPTAEVKTLCTVLEKIVSGIQHEELNINKPGKWPIFSTDKALVSIIKQNKCVQSSQSFCYDCFCSVNNEAIEMTIISTNLRYYQLSIKIIKIAFKLFFIWLPRTQYGAFDGGPKKWTFACYWVWHVMLYWSKRESPTSSNRHWHCRYQVAMFVRYGCVDSYFVM